jgi:hypothetical protein
VATAAAVKQAGAVPFPSGVYPIREVAAVRLPLMSVPQMAVRAL